MGSLNGLPPFDPSLKEKEKNSVEGDVVTVTLSFYRDGVEQPFKIISIPLQQGTEVMKVKRKLYNQYGFDPGHMEFKYNGRLMLDPISLVDAWGSNPEHHMIDVHVLS